MTPLCITAGRLPTSNNGISDESRDEKYDYMMARKRRDRQAMKCALLKLPDSLLHLLLHRLVRVHNCLLVNHDLRRVRPRTAHP